MTTTQYMQHVMRGPNSQTTITDSDEPTIIDLVKTIWSHPLGKFLLITAGGTILLGGAGLLFRLLAWVKTGWIGFRDAGK